MSNKQTSLATPEFSVIFSILMHFNVGYNILRGRDKTMNMKRATMDVMRLLDLDSKVIPYIEKLLLTMCAMRQVYTEEKSFSNENHVYRMFGILYHQKVLTANECISLYRPIYEDMNPDKDFGAHAIDRFLDQVVFSKIIDPSHDFIKTSNWIKEVNSTHKSIFTLLPYLVHIGETFLNATMKAGESDDSYVGESDHQVSIMMEYMEFLKFATELDSLKKMHAGQLNDKIQELKTRVRVAG